MFISKVKISKKSSKCLRYAICLMVSQINFISSSLQTLPHVFVLKDKKEYVLLQEKGFFLDSLKSINSVANFIKQAFEEHKHRVCIHEVSHAIPLISDKKQLKNFEDKYGITFPTITLYFDNDNNYFGCVWPDSPVGRHDFFLREEKGFSSLSVDEIVFLYKYLYSGFAGELLFYPKRECVYVYSDALQQDVLIRDHVKESYDVSKLREMEDYLKREKRYTPIDFMIIRKEVDDLLKKNRKCIFDYANILFLKHQKASQRGDNTVQLNIDVASENHISDGLKEFKLPSCFLGCEGYANVYENFKIFGKKYSFLSLSSGSYAHINEDKDKWQSKLDDNFVSDFANGSVFRNRKVSLKKNDVLNTSKSV